MEIGKGTMWIRIRAVIIEDEPLAAQYLAGLLNDTCQVEVVGTAAESEAGLRLCAELRPDAVLVDINLESGPFPASGDHAIGVPRPDKITSAANELTACGSATEWEPKSRLHAQARHGWPRS
jgi:DNA-binding NarL/FixJ family response regulator